MSQKLKTYILEVHFKSESDLQAYVDDHFGSGVIGVQKSGSDELHLRSYTKKMYAIKPTNDPDSMSHFMVKNN